jgi:hypothetical protein
MEKIMRYFIVHYRRVMAAQGFKKQEQMDEIVEVKRNIRLKDQQMAAVILDLRSKDVEKQDQAIVIIRNGYVNIPMVADQEINLEATLIELSHL